MTDEKYTKRFKDKIEVSMSGASFRLVGAITLWVALFWGDPDISDGIIKFLMTAHDACVPK